MKSAFIILLLGVSLSMAEDYKPSSMTNCIDMGFTNGYSRNAVTNVLAYDIENLIRRIHDYGQTKELVKALAKQGKICEVLGHKWRGGRPGESGGVTFCDLHPGVTYRTCEICNKCESMSMEWK